MSAEPKFFSDKVVRSVSNSNDKTKEIITMATMILLTYISSNFENTDKKGKLK